MALIDLDSFERIDKIKNHVHDLTTATFTIFDEGGERYFQIDTYGRASRAIPDKISQSIQLDRETAQELVRLLQDAFNLK